MPRSAPALPDGWKNWTPTAQEKFLERLRRGNLDTWRPFYCTRPDCDGNHHLTVKAPHDNTCVDTYLHRWELVGRTWRCGTVVRDQNDRIIAACKAVGTPQDDWLFLHGRSSQHPPPGMNWLVWLMMAGRGAGKTRAGSEWVHRLARAHPGCRIALISPTANDVRDTIAEGESGLLATARPGEMPDWEPSKKRLTWPNGSIATGYSGEEPDRLRGKQHHFGWLDEPAHIALIDDVWSNFLFGLRLGDSPKICLTTSPLPIPWLKDLVADPTTKMSRASTYANIRNLPTHYKTQVLGKYEGTRTGRQEIHGHLLEDVEGALWNNTMIDAGRIAHIDDIPELDRIVVAVDPAGTKGKRSDETGIIVGGSLADEQYVWADYSGRYSPDEWAGRVLWAYDTWAADAVVVEITYGRDMVVRNLEAYCERHQRPMPRIITVDSRRGKRLRAEPVVAFYERGQTHHVGILEDLENQQTSWVPDVTVKSPDRVDALVHLITELAHTSAPGMITTPYDLGRSDNVTSITRTIYERTRIA